LPGTATAFVDAGPRWGRKIAICAIVGIIFAIAAALAPRAWDFLLAKPGPLPEARVLVIPHGGSATVAQALQNAGVIDQPLVFRLAVWSSPGAGPLRAAEFAFPPHVSLSQVLSILRTARPVQHHLTIAEGLTAQQIAAVLARAEAATGQAAIPAEGSVLPQTYDYEYGADRAALQSRAQGAMARLVEVAWAGRAPGLPLATPKEAVILASIIERETALPSERAHVAAVYVNRLRLGMKLEADPTVAYGISGGSGLLEHPLTRADLRKDNPYNTYRNTGLPPGPICAPGRESIEAALHPAVSDDLYFVADGTGGHVFSHDFATHDAAVARWRALNAAPVKPN